jgi:soluble lytic murein transglycosylase-like protein
MDALRRLAAAFALLAAVPAQADNVDRWRPYMEQASARCGVPVEWIEQVMTSESAGLTMLNDRLITSPAGAMGLMQLMPATWMEMRTALRLGTNPHDPRDNIVAGSCYLRLMYDRFGYPGLFAAYNAGPGRYRAYLAGRAGWPEETITYLSAVTGKGASGRIAPPVSPPRLFAIGQPRTEASPADGLFFIRADEE